MKLAFVFGQAMNWLLVLAATAPAAATDPNVNAATDAIKNITGILAGLAIAAVTLVIVIKALEMLLKGSADAIKDIKLILGLVIAVLLLILLRDEIVSIVTTTINNAIHTPKN